MFSRGEISRLIRLHTRVNGEALTEFNADGLIIATPTGSTAYSLSAGGPIMEPESGVFVITPICPHVLTNRSIIVSENSVIEVEASEPDYPVYLTVDGREPLRIAKDAKVEIRKAKKKLRLASLPGYVFLQRRAPEAEVERQQRLKQMLRRRGVEPQLAAEASFG